MRRFALGVLVVGSLLLVTGCMGGGDSDRSTRRAAITEELPELHARLTLGGNQINVRSFAWGIDGPQAHQLQLVRLIDENSPPVFDSTAQATSYQSATLELIDSGGRMVATYVFSNVVVASFQNSMSAGELALESLSLTYQQVDFTYGSANACFDFARQRPC